MRKASNSKQRAHIRQSLQPACKRVSETLIPFAKATSLYPGHNCLALAELGRLLLHDLGIRARMTAGFASWRVGPGIHDVIGHVEGTPGVLPAGVKGLRYHTWLEEQGFIIDFTTFQLRQKAEVLDAADGGHTMVSWHPDFLLLPLKKVRSAGAVNDATRPGMVYYESRPELASIVLKDFELDPKVITFARNLLKSHANAESFPP